MKKSENPKVSALTPGDKGSKFYKKASNLLKPYSTNSEFFAKTWVALESKTKGHTWKRILKILLIAMGIWVMILF